MSSRAHSVRDSLREMSAIQPITGRFRRQLVLNISGALALGVGLAFAYHYRYTVPALVRVRAHDKAVRSETLEEADQWFKENNYSR